MDLNWFGSNVPGLAWVYLLYDAFWAETLFEIGLASAKTFMICDVTKAFSVITISSLVYEHAMQSFMTHVTI